MFPISIRRKTQLKLDSLEATEWVFKYIEGRLKKLKVDNITLINNHIDFKNGILNGQGSWHVMGPVTSGYFDFDNSTSTMTYEFSTIRMFIITTVMSLGFGFSTKSAGLAIFGFLWLYGMNWIIVIIRHKTFFKKLMDDIKSENYKKTNNKGITPRPLGQNV